MTTVGAMLRQERKKLRMSREKLAAKIGSISSSTIKRVEAGADNASPEAIEAIAAALGMAYDRSHKLLRDQVLKPGESTPDTLERIARELLVIAMRLRGPDNGG